MSRATIRTNSAWPALLAAVAIVALCAETVWAESLAEFEQRLEAMQTRVAAADSDPQRAGEVIDELDRAEAAFADFTLDPNANPRLLRAAYDQLEGMLDGIYQTYHRKHDECLKIIGNGGQCDYEQPEQLELRALYPLSWLRFHGNVLFRDQAARRQRMLQDAITGFTQSTILIIAPDLIRENLLGRAYAERDLGRFQHDQYAHAIADFRQVLKAGPGSAQYRAAQQGLATTYAAMGEADKAAAMTAEIATGAAGSQAAELFHLQELMKAEAATSDPAKRATYHRQAVDTLRSLAREGKDWPTAVAAVERYIPDPAAELGSGSDGFENYLLAMVLYATHHPLPAAQHYLIAAHSGRYPEAYEYAVEILYAQGRFDLIAPVLDTLVRQGRQPQAEWAAYMRFKLARLQWEHGGKRDAALNSRWIARAHDYLKRYPRGRYAYEPRFRLAELLEQDKQYAQAAGQYDEVRGDPYYDFAAAFQAAQCRYQLLAASWDQGHAAPDLTQAALKGFRATLAQAPALSKRIPSQRAFVLDACGRSAYLMAAILVRQPQRDNAQIARLLQGYETSYPALSANFADVFRWRLQALNALGRYEEAAHQIALLIAPDAHPAPSSDFIKTIGLDLWSESLARRVRGDKAGALADARLTSQTYGYFERAVAAGKIPAKDLAGTLSILGEAYLAMNQPAAAKAAFEQVVKASPASPDANAGLARLAQADKDYKDAAELWNRVETNAAESDDLWYEAQYNLAVIYAADGRVAAACGKLASTRSEHPALDGPQMKARWEALQRKLCLGQARTGL